MYMDEGDVTDDEVAMNAMIEMSEPNSYAEAMSCNDKNQWLNAITEEFKSQEKCGTWRLVLKNHIPKDSSKVKARWVFKRKVEANNATQYKVRLVAKGYADKNNYDISEVYAPVARLGDIQFILALANRYNLELAQLDVKTAFLNRTLKKAVYMEILEGLKE